MLRDCGESAVDIVTTTIFLPRFEKHFLEESRKGENS